jgi:solute carrier family 35 protein C2
MCVMTSMLLLLLLLSFLPCSPSWSLAGVVAVIVSGLLLLVRGEADFDTTGFVLVMSASCMSGLRFTLTQVLLHGNRSNSSSSSGQQEQGQGKPAADSHGEWCEGWTVWRCAL